jgi:hypothetical protein
MELSACLIVIVSSTICHHKNIGSQVGQTSKPASLHGPACQLLFHVDDLTSTPVEFYNVNLTFFLVL